VQEECFDFEWSSRRLLAGLTLLGWDRGYGERAAQLSPLDKVHHWMASMEGWTLPAQPEPVKKPGRARAAPVAPVSPIVDTSGKSQSHGIGSRAIIPTGPMAGKRWLTEIEVEEFYGLNAKTLRNKRSDPDRAGEGPPWRRFGKLVKYQVAALEAWIERQPQGGDGVPASALKRHRT
jgi:hypothetical protein